MQEGDGFVLVFALDSRSAFQEMAHIQQQILRVKDAETFPMILVGNKSDLNSERQVSTTGKNGPFRCFHIRG
jgi:GTPase KRas protein